ncbi:5-oxoprolinase subunit C family protein [Seonamhaeicola marinus]|uniref:Biotin-dependent carboxyltransferase family protein n=1 Tax=Seonamhaeicola marinus TaxID=1912246 RepID=A0A5D0I4A7_9FLAO|nr:biotin-dependent carboxyltransferase family protein [Seonamhaeicola marinus]TYA78553.1 biotin-dependent carboxyltransferase family protein [Seonamhaeicola marinus]
MIKVLSTGIYSTIQDFGRFGVQNYGIPYSGVMDKQSASFSNAILGNPIDLPVMEITMLGPKLQFETKTRICISGGDLSPKLNNNPIFNNKSILVETGDVLSFGKLNRGFRAYLSVQGGFKTENVLGSYSMYQDITPKSRVEKGDILKIASFKDNGMRANASIKVTDTHLDTTKIDVDKGPEFDQLSEDQKKYLLSKTFSISKDNNRMAYQLNEVLENTLEPIITSLVKPGTIQLTPSGKLIVLMKDCQTTGGYPRVLQLKTAAINVMSQKYTGQMVSFSLDMY